jgi:hypothetical protein
MIRVVKMHFRYGLDKASHPLLRIPFWTPGHKRIVRLSPEDISCIVPAHFAETGVRVFVTDPALVASATPGFEKWKQQHQLS